MGVKASMRPSTKAETVLFVDDETALLDAIATVLRKEPYRVLKASSGAEALAVLRSTPVDVVVSDERMACMRGTELLAKIRLEYPTIVRIMLTGEVSLATTAAAIEAGGLYRLLGKPLDPSDLKATLRQGLRMRELTLRASTLCSAAAR